MCTIIIMIKDCDSQLAAEWGVQLNGKPFFALKTTRASGQNICKSCFPLSWSLENPLVP